MPRGGRRVGAGRKPGKKQAVVLGMDGARRGDFVLPPAMQASVSPDPVGDSLVEPPADLSDAIKAVWRALAPLAIEQRTLTASKVPGFRDLCLRWVYCADFDARIWEFGGPSRHEAEPLVKRLEKWRPMLGNSLKEFKLTAFGKPDTAEKTKVAVNPWTKVGGK